MANLPILDNNNVNVKTSSTSNSSTTILSRLHLLGYGLKTALPKLKPLKIIVPKRIKASAISSNSAATKFTVTSCLPLQCFRFGLKAPEPDQTVDNGSLATALESDSGHVVQPFTSTKSTIPTCLSLPLQSLGHFQESLKTELLSKPSKSNVTRKEEEEVLSKRPNVAEDLILKAGNKLLKEGSKGQRYLWNLARQHFINRKLKNTILMNIHNKYRMVRSVGEDCSEEKELKTLIANKPEPICFNRFQPSGLMHIAEGIMEVMNVNKLTNAGCRVKILIADQLARMNKKLGGDMEKIETVGLYMIEVWKAMGMNLKDGKVEILWSSKEVGSRVNEYLDLVSDITDKNSLARLKRCWKLMDRTDEVVYLNASQISTLGMQCADIFFLQADICQFGMDKREVNILAREYCDEIQRKNKPIVLSHHILPGLKEGQEKMSKKIPNSAIFMNDNEAEVNRKIEEAFCPEKVVEGNPCLEYIKYLIFPWFNGFVVEQIEQDGGVRTFKSFEDLIVHYQCGILQPDDLKVALSKAINKILQPVRNHFEDNDTAKQLLQSILSYEVSG
ncbi:tyrosine--tRNA ligase 1, cytoplasmic [Rosa sericea]